MGKEKFWMEGQWRKCQQQVGGGGGEFRKQGELSLEETGKSMANF